MNTVTMRGNPLDLAGNEVGIGQKAPDFTLIAKDMSERKLKDYLGKVIIIAAVPSLDTGVCDMEVRRFNTEAAALSKDIVILAVSCDLPFAQARWCGAAGVESVETLSDHRDLSFGKHYGVVISKLRLLARSTFIIDRQGYLAYVNIVPEVTNEPNYTEILEEAKKSL